MLLNTFAKVRINVYSGGIFSEKNLIEILIFNRNKFFNKNTTECKRVLFFYDKYMLNFIVCH